MSSQGMLEDIEAAHPHTHPPTNATADDIRSLLSSADSMHMAMASVVDRVTEALAAPRELEADKESVVQALRERYQRVLWPLRPLLLESPPVSPAPPPEELQELRMRFDSKQQELVRLLEEAAHRDTEGQELLQQLIDHGSFFQCCSDSLATEIKSVQTALANGEIPQLTPAAEAGKDPVSVYRAEAILGVRPDAPAAEVDRAYRTLSRLYHPDRCGGLDPAIRASMSATFRRLTVCYETLIAKKGVPKGAASPSMVDAMVEVVVKADRLQEACSAQRVVVQREMDALEQEGEQGTLVWTLRQASKRLKSIWSHFTGSTPSATNTDPTTEQLTDQETEVLQRCVAWQLQAIEDLTAMADSYKATMHIVTKVQKISDSLVRLSEVVGQEVDNEARARGRKPKSRKAEKHQAMTQGACFDLLRLPHDAPVDLILMAYKAWVAVYEGQGTTKGTDASAMLKRLEDAYKWCVMFAGGKANKASGKRHMGANGKGRGRRQCQQQQQQQQEEEGVVVDAAVDGTRGGQYECDELD